MGKYRFSLDYKNFCGIQCIGMRICGNSDDLENWFKNGEREMGICVTWGGKVEVLNLGVEIFLLYSFIRRNFIEGEIYVSNIQVSFCDFMGYSYILQIDVIELVGQEVVF